MLPQMIGSMAGNAVSDVFGKSSAQEARSVRDALYPGISDWDVLTAGGGGFAQAGAASTASRRQAGSAMAQQMTAGDIAKLQAKSNIKVAGINAEAQIEKAKIENGFSEFGISPKDQATIENLTEDTRLKLRQGLESVERARKTGSEAELQAALADVKSLWVQNQLSSKSWAQLTDQTAGRMGIALGELIKLLKGSSKSSNTSVKPAGIPGVNLNDAFQSSW